MFLLDVSVDDLAYDALLVGEELQIQRFYSTDYLHFPFKLGTQFFVLLTKCLDHVDDLLHYSPGCGLIFGPFHELLLVVLAHGDE